MKTTRINILVVTLLWIMLLQTGCVNQIIDTPEEEEPTESVPISISTRTNDGTALNYPVTLYAFDEEGVCAATKRLATATEDSKMLLSTGIYTLVAFSGIDGYSLPATPKLTDLITLADGAPATQALWAGNATVQITDQTTTANITLTAAVSRINLSLTGIPDNITGVSVTMGSLYEGMSFGATYAGSTMATITLNKTATTTREETDGNTWSAPTFYLFPGTANTRLSLSITLTHTDGTTVTNAYTADRTLLGNTPYRLEGTYAEGFGVNSNLNWSQWNDEQLISFHFGGKNNEGNGNNNGGTVTEFPIAGSTWNGHFVALSTPDEEGKRATLTLFSLKEWTDVSAAVEGSENPTAAATHAAAYSEAGSDNSNITGWHIPTKEEARAIRKAIGETNERLTETNATLLSLKGTGISVGEEKKGVTIRYLCQDATYSINFYGTSGVTGCGSKRTYRLRLVANVTVSKE